MSTHTPTASRLCSSLSALGVRGPLTKTLDTGPIESICTGYWRRSTDLEIFSSTNILFVAFGHLHHVSRLSNSAGESRFVTAWE